MGALLIVSLAYIVSFVFGYFVEKLRVPWVFSALFVGIAMALLGLKVEVLDVLGYMGMVLMLFNLGLELDLREIRSAGSLIVRSTVGIVLAEAVVGTLLIHYLFGCNPFVSGLVALSFATVGEAVLLPILEEYRLVTSKLGEFIIGVGVLDDLFELVVIVLASVLLGSAAGHGMETISLHLLVLLVLFLLVGFIRVAKRLHMQLPYPRLGASLPMALSIFFLFLGIGRLAGLDALASIFAGISLRLFLKPSVLMEVAREIRTITYGFFAPLFFLWVGITIDVGSLLENLQWAVLITLLTALTKIVATTLATGRYLNLRESLAAGIGLCVRFSTSIAVLKMLYDAQLIGAGLYSSLVASTALFTLIVPFIFAWLVADGA